MQIILKCWFFDSEHVLFEFGASRKLWNFVGKTLEHWISMVNIEIIRFLSEKGIPIPMVSHHKKGI
jgi:hypothetical protein